MVKLLVKHRTNVLAADKHGCCAIHAAVWGGSLKCLKLVMGGGGGGGVQLKDIFGCTPLMHAAAKVTHILYSSCYHRLMELVLP